MVKIYSTGAFIARCLLNLLVLADAEQIHGKQLSFNNIYDADAAWRMACEFDEPCVVAVKHTNPCGFGSSGFIGKRINVSTKRIRIDLWWNRGL